MKKLEYKFIKEGMLNGILIPISIAFIDYANVKKIGISMKDACKLVASQIEGPTAINMLDMEATTTNSDGVMIDGAITCIAASDRGKINEEFGYLEMMEVQYSGKLLKEEPHLKQWKIRYPYRRLIMGPDPAKKVIPVHNTVMTGRAGNNNSGTEIMNFITMEELLLPITGQIQIMKGTEVEIGGTGEIISVGLGIVVAEKYGRIFSNRPFKCGETAHKSGEYSKSLKCHIPFIGASKNELAKYIIGALKAGMIPGRDISPSPAILSVAKYMGIEPDYDNMTEDLFIELESVGYSKEWMKEKVETLEVGEIIERADEIIKGMKNSKKYKVSDLVEIKHVEL